MKKIVFVGQTPPPFGGQAIMIEKILAGQYEGIKLFHVRLAFSKEMNEIGKASLSKIFHLFNVIARIYYLRIFRGADILYYPPAGPDKIPILRDIVILISVRWMFKKTIFHFHAGGVSQIHLRSRFLQRPYQLAYYYADWAILLSPLNPRDGKNLKATNEIVIPYGIEDHGFHFRESSQTQNVNILFVGIIKESKGVVVLLEAARELRRKRLPFSVQIMGKFESLEFEQALRYKIKEFDIQDQVKFLGVLSGDLKYKVFQEAEIFCFPTFFESETFGVVLLEAMQFCLPVVATAWRGIPSIVVDRVTGFLVSPKNADEVAKALEVLILDPAMRLRMGNEGRKLYLDKFTLDRFQAEIGNFFKNC